MFTKKTQVFAVLFCLSASFALQAMAQCGVTRKGDVLCGRNAPPAAATSGGEGASFGDQSDAFVGEPQGMVIIPYAPAQPPVNVGTLTPVPPPTGQSGPPTVPITMPVNTPSPPPVCRPVKPQSPGQPTSPSTPTQPLGKCKPGQDALSALQERLAGANADGNGCSHGSLGLEGCKNCAYNDSVGKLTIGIGHLVKSGDGVSAGTCWSNAQVAQQFQSDSSSYFAYVQNTTSKLGICDGCFAAALGDVFYQWGHGTNDDPGYLGTNRTGRQVNAQLQAGNYEAAAQIVDGDAYWHRISANRANNFAAAIRALPPKGTGCNK